MWDRRSKSRHTQEPARTGSMTLIKRTYFLRHPARRGFPTNEWPGGMFPTLPVLPVNGQPWQRQQRFSCFALRYKFTLRSIAVCIFTIIVRRSLHSSFISVFPIENPRTCVISILCEFSCIQEFYTWVCSIFVTLRCSICGVMATVAAMMVPAPSVGMAKAAAMSSMSVRGMSSSSLSLTCRRSAVKLQGARLMTKCMAEVSFTYVRLG